MSERSIWTRRPPDSLLQEGVIVENKYFSSQVITICAMLIALGVILSFLRIPLSAVTEITLTGLPIAVGGYMLGPWIGFLIGALIDICGFLLLRRGHFFPDSRSVPHLQA